MRMLTAFDRSARGEDPPTIQSHISNTRHHHQPRMKTAAALLCLLGLVVAKKGSEPDPEILNPASEGPPDLRAESNPDLVEGDLVIQGNSDRNAIADPETLWPNAVVPYKLDSILSEDVVKTIKEAIADFHKYTCVRWKETDDSKDTKDFVLFTSRTPGCFSNLGRSGGEQTLNLDPRGCNYKGTAIHEMLHAIGFGHEHNRNDRDEYIRINWQNMKGGHDQFQKLASENNQGFPYDYMSVLHYDAMGFSSNGKPVIFTKDPKYQKKIGKQLGFSKTDVAEVKKLYKC